MRIYEVFEVGLVADNECGTFNLQEILLLKSGEEPGDRLTRCANHFCDLFVSYRQLGADLACAVPVANAPIKKKPRQFFPNRAREANRTHFRDGGMIGRAQLLSHAYRNPSVFPKKTKKIWARYEILLHG